MEIYEVTQHHRIQTLVDYNQFFHPNVCHVCKSTDQSNLISCARCHMISYCSEEHRKQHLSHHEDICTVIAMFIDENPEWNTQRLTANCWIEKQKNLIQICGAVLGYQLKTYEVQMFMFAKVCFICHQRHNLFTCQKCFCISYCKDHMSERSLHIFACKDLALSLNLDIIFLERTPWTAIYVKCPNFLNKKKPFTDMNLFCHQYYEELRKYNRWSFNVYSFTDYVSGPLTLYKALQIANLFHLQKETHTFIIHIIAANYVDRRNFPAWEYFLHLLSKKVMKIVIVMIGPELQYENNEHNVCSRCKAANRRLILQSFPLLYHNYTFSSDYRRPNVIVGFQAELDGESWSESLKAIQTQNCLLLLTAKSRLRAYWDIIKIQQVLGTFIKPVLEMTNYFVSCRPYRDLDTGYVFLPNTYLVMYKNLSISIEASNSTVNN
ncbi:uncharacterized protein LOC116843072 [Odontomachus brunneus]|uniref:uncharacterized protein LOC116843072 n=1 Tax=Odontomachus brunneus TaxID=486640 RepID=UPI0013F1C708|nr:uncharacterized protein LOC116843072 [Odontomachus brunneus]